MANIPQREPDVRASDADRERFAHVLRQAAGDGRLTLAETEERLGWVFASRTIGQLEQLVADLAPEVYAGSTAAASGLPSWSSAYAVMSGCKRRGPWSAPKRFTAFSFWGKSSIDLREAVFPAGETKITAFAFMGGVEVVVPPDLNVQVEGVGMMGGFGQGASGPGAAGSPLVIVTGLAMWGSVSVKRRERRADRRARRSGRRSRR
ncbi:DUF1707 SHOCT-like domain-containing protein [Actinomadura rayongensis]|uniref:DUF1707 domain-containing protein n=1 Tax=Actinomadura rayongensis TaxID=1429076 RepID=A0A6I4WKA1_9ACTN|nr:DUF1707 domain-containing protein [Actinomadura rayongensis]MXQ67384.1 DUF1707 domain-containing protein [Actinomadura rayongensis]